MPPLDVSKKVKSEQEETIAERMQLKPRKTKKKTETRLKIFQYY